MPILYALLTIFAWGLWLIPSQNLGFSGQQVRTFYVAAANLLIAVLFTAVQGFGKVTADVVWLPFWAGMVWSLGGWAAFTATDKLGVVREFGKELLAMQRIRSYKPIVLPNFWLVGPGSPVLASFLTSTNTVAD